MTDASLHQESPEPFDVILWNKDEEVTETTISNVAICLDTAVSPLFVTPPLSSGILPGVQRSELLERGEIVEGVVRLEEVREGLKVRSDAFDARVALMM